MEEQRQNVHHNEPPKMPNFFEVDKKKVRNRKHTVIT